MTQNGVVCQPGPALLFFIFRFEYLITDPNSYRDFGETGPWALIKFLDLEGWCLFEAGRLVVFCFCFFFLTMKQ